MAAVIRMPGVSADADSATLVEWSVAAGDTVAAGDLLATVETDKAVVEIEAEESGTLLRLFADAGQVVAIGGPIAVLLHDGEDAKDEDAIVSALGLGPQSSGPLQPADEERSQDELVPDTATPAAHTADEVVAPSTPATDDDQARTERNGRIFATPLVRRLAQEAGVGLEDLRGTGPNGRIRRRDLETALAQRTQEPERSALTPVSAPPSTTPGVPAAGAGYTDEPASRFRRAVAAALTRSKQEVPHFYLKATCRAEALLTMRSGLNEGASHRVTVNDLLVKAAAAAMVRVPEMNVVWTGDGVRRFDGVDIAVAMATERGLVVPVVRSAATRSLSDLSATVKDLAERAAANTLKQSELEGGVLAVSNLGMFGIEEFSAIINPPQVGILAVGAVTPRAVEGADGQLELARCITVTLSVDHRPVDGALAARWLREFVHLVENPLQILA